MGGLINSCKYYNKSSNITLITFYNQNTLQNPNPRLYTKLNASTLIAAFLIQNLNNFQAQLGY